MDNIPEIKVLNLSKREYFAAMAMQGLLADKSVYKEDQDGSLFKDFAVCAVFAADALLEALDND